ncbi:mechanosensitive ion channel family protein [Pontibaca salina]|uniref:Small-conductance mechanosensitive channel n=1 Tax=Pontibaca salina TaxID=2795731 RepID=A0A934HNV4_9RHOB|nr:mechanosensitive ion channel domain-containing protein [Pontibaca salina]MBI6628822.1 mechanosensitive ion channel family protein [Pontibaca salina]
MSAKQNLRRLVWPVVLMIVAVGLLINRTALAGLFENGDLVILAITALSYFSAAWLLSRIVALVLDQNPIRKRRYPRLLKDLIAVILFFVAFAATGALFMGQGAVGALAGSGLVIAMLGFAIRNVVADTLSGIALGIEGPFRIGDWIDIDGLARGKVIEIGWRTTRILTRDSAYTILPNSQIARQRIINYSAPKPQYRAQIAITLDHTLPISTARELMLEAVKKAKLIQQDPSPDVRVRSYDEGGITYSVRYWLSRFERDVDCRDEVYSLIDDALRQAGSIVPHRRIELVRSGARGSSVMKDDFD